jgi:membrane associated rhomboid family serine protease
MRPRYWLVVFPTVLFFSLLGSAVLSDKATTIHLDNAGAIVGLAIGLVVGLAAVWFALKGENR